MRTYTINLALEISEEDLESKGRDEDTQRDELYDIAHQWADGLERQCIPKVRVKVKATDVRES